MLERIGSLGLRGLDPFGGLGRQRGRGPVNVQRMAYGKAGMAKPHARTGPGHDLPDVLAQFLVARVRLPRRDYFCWLVEVWPYRLPMTLPSIGLI